MAQPFDAGHAPFNRLNHARKPAWARETRHPFRRRGELIQRPKEMAAPMARPAEVKADRKQLEDLAEDHE